MSEGITAQRFAGISRTVEDAGMRPRKFGWIVDPDGNRIELWEPLPEKE